MPYTFNPLSGKFDYYTSSSIPAFTTGSVIFQGATTLAQDNANFFWDDSNNRLGIGTASPLSRLNLEGSGATLTFSDGFGGIGNYRFSISTTADAGSAAGNIMQLKVNPANTTTQTTVMTLDGAGNTGIGTVTPAARLHLIRTTEQLRVGFDASNYFSTTIGSTGGVTFDAVGSGAGFTFSDSVNLRTGSATAGTYPLKFTSGALLTSPVIGVKEFLTDKFYGTITTSTARKEFTLNDIALTSGRVALTTTNGRLTDSVNLSYSGSVLTNAFSTVSNAYARFQGTNITTTSTGANRVEIGATPVGTRPTIIFEESGNVWEQYLVTSLMKYKLNGTDILTFDSTNLNFAGSIVAGNGFIGSGASLTSLPAYGGATAIQYSSASNTLTGDATSFNWNFTDKFMGVNKTTPEASIHIGANTVTVGAPFSASALISGVGVAGGYTFGSGNKDYFIYSKKTVGAVDIFSSGTSTGFNEPSSNDYDASSGNASINYSGGGYIASGATTSYTIWAIYPNSQISVIGTGTNPVSDDSSFNPYSIDVSFTAPTGQVPVEYLIGRSYNGNPIDYQIISSTSFSDTNSGWTTSASYSALAYGVNISFGFVAGATDWLVENTTNATYSLTGFSLSIIDIGSGWTSGTPTVTPTSYDTPSFIAESAAVFNSTVRLAGYAIGSLPSTATIGDMAYINDGLTVPAKGVAPTAGGTSVGVVFFDGSAWVGI